MIQIFGTNKNFDCKKAQMWFKERRIPFQFIDLKEKEMSAGEFESVLQVMIRQTGSREAALEQMTDKKNKDYSSIAWLDESEKVSKLFENQQLLVQPVCRNGKDKASVGLNTKVWETWK
jgi:arsenate reductase-like glutaredoxin family protein